MPLGIQRINPHAHAPNTLPHPNDRITFIKPLPGASSSTAHDFLSRVAAICVPIMRHHHLSITTLEEHEPNREFIGRNFNGGEIIQLVLRARDSGRWLPFRMVQMVMMHELAHCVHMNHSRAFWGVKNVYSEDLKRLWANGFSGEGLWGRGRTLYDGQFEEGSGFAEGEGLPENLCGGTYRSRGRKRKRGASGQLSYAERKQRRIEKKFGKNGEALGDDEETRMLLERGKSVAGKPKVAGSKRGRDLRAAAAVLRFEHRKNAKEYEEKQQREAEAQTSTGDASDSEDEATGELAVYADGSKMVDTKGRDMIKICEDEETGSDEAQREMEELGGMLNSIKTATNSGETSKSKRLELNHSTHEDDSTTEGELDGEEPIDAAPPEFARPSSGHSGTPSSSKITTSTNIDARPKTPEYHANAAPPHQFPKGRTPSRDLEEVILPRSQRPKYEDRSRAPTRAPDSAPVDPSASKPAPISALGPTSASSRNTASVRPSNMSPLPVSVPDNNHAEEPPPEQVCAVCSLSNSSKALTCAACAHVLDTERLPRYWRCGSEMCTGGKYVNAEDAGVCGICGKPRLG